MAAIDLLFDVKRDSERLHQLVLGALFQRTTLLGRLVPLASPPTQPQLQWEPDGKAYDLGILLHGDGPRDASRSGARRERVLVEIKLDTAVSEEKLAQQCNSSRLHAEDRLLYLLLGYSAITSDRNGLRERIRRIGEHTARPDLLDRVSLRDADDVIPLLADPTLLPGGPDHRDARDLSAAYRDALLTLAARTRRFADRSVDSWQDGDFFGFFAACRSRNVAGMGRARIGRLAGPDGSVVACSFAETQIFGGLGSLELQFDNARLSLRVHATAERKALRQRVVDAMTGLDLLGEPSLDGLRFELAPLRLSTAMSVAQLDGLIDGFPSGSFGGFDWERFTARITAAEDALRKVAARIGP